MTLLSVPDRVIASPAVGIARVVGLSAWLLPLASIGAAIALSRTGWQTAA